MRFQILFGWLVLVCVWFYSKNGIQGQCPAYSNFVVQHGYRLYGHVITWLYAENEVLCRLKCNLEQRCLTFNFEEATRICELNDADHKEDLQKAPGFVYVDMKKSTRKYGVTSTSTTPPTSTSATPLTSTSTTQTSKMDTISSPDASTSTSPPTSAVTTQSAVTVTSVSTTPPTTKPGQCKEEAAIGIQSTDIIPDAYITASKNKDLAKRARLNGNGGWYCKKNTPCNNQWIQVNVGKIAKITGIETQGAAYQSCYTEKYRLSYSNGSTFIDYNNRQALQGNNDNKPIVYNELTPAITARYVRVHPMKYNDKSGCVGLRMELYECKDDEGQCKHKDEPIGIQNKTIIPDNYITGSTNKEDANKARLNNPEGWHLDCSSWSTTCGDQWLQVNVGKIAKITGIATQGVKHDTHSFWMEKYRLSYSNGSQFTDYKQVFNGNKDSDTTVYNVIAPAIIAIYVRIHPQTDYYNSVDVGLRMELYECKEDEGICSYSLGMQNKRINDSQITASSQYGQKNRPSNGRLNDKDGWVSEYNDQNPWLQIDLHQIIKINGIATQGHANWIQYWVKEYRLQYRNDTIKAFHNYTVHGEPKTFQGNTDHNNIVLNALDSPIIAQIVRILPTALNNRYIALRVELYGCPYKGSYNNV